MQLPVFSVESDMAKAKHAAAKRAAKVLLSQIDAKARELRKERQGANANRKRSINLHLSKLRKARSCVVMCAWGTACSLSG
jgi:hypothetical protein